MELSRLFRATAARGRAIVLFDGEDWGRDLDEMFLGSRYFADHRSAGPSATRSSSTWWGTPICKSPRAPLASKRAPSWTKYGGQPRVGL